MVSWAVTDAYPITSNSLTVDSAAVAPIFGPYGPFSGSFYYSGVFGPLAAGPHTYAIHLTDSNGQSASATATFVVAAVSGPVISMVEVAEATPQNGILESNERGVISWALTDSNTITSTSLTVDGAAVSPIFGPYGPFSGSFYYSGVFGPLAAGSHAYAIQATDSAGQNASATGTFVVSPAAGPAISLVEVAAAAQNGVLRSNEQGVISWALTDASAITSTSLTVNGATVTPIFGPYGPFSGSFYYSGVFGPLAAGGYSFAIQATDSQGHSSSYSGSFSVAAA